jgi:hypothetical protein
MKSLIDTIRSAFVKLNSPEAPLQPEINELDERFQQFEADVETQAKAAVAAAVSANGASPEQIAALEKRVAALEAGASPVKPAVTPAPAPAPVPPKPATPAPAPAATPAA